MLVSVSVYMQRVSGHVSRWTLSLALTMTGLVAAVVQRVLTPEAGPSMPSSLTTPTGIDCWSSAITASPCVCVGERERGRERGTEGGRERERDSHPSCQLFYYVSDRGLPGRQAAWQSAQQSCGVCPMFCFVFCLWLCKLYLHIHICFCIYSMVLTI